MKRFDERLRELGLFRQRLRAWKKRAPGTLALLRKLNEASLSGPPVPPFAVLEKSEGVYFSNRAPEIEVGYANAFRFLPMGSRNPFRLETVLEFHRRLYEGTHGKEAGVLKSRDNRIAHVRGPVAVASAGETQRSLRRVLGRFERAWKKSPEKRLVLLGSFLEAFWSVHPFLDGNGRTGRLLVQAFLVADGHEIPYYEDLEKLMHQTRKTYGFSIGSEDFPGRAKTPAWKPVPLTAYYLEMLCYAYRQLESKIAALVYDEKERLARREVVLAKLPKTFSLGDLQRLLPESTLPELKSALLARGARRQTLSDGHELWVL